MYVDVGRGRLDVGHPVLAASFSLKFTKKTLVNVN